MERLTPLHLSAVERLPRTCGTCPLGAGRVPGLDADWALAAEREFGCVGFIVQAGVDTPVPVAFLMWAPPSHAPRGGPQARVPQAWPRTRDGDVLRPWRRMRRAPLSDSAVILQLRVLDGEGEWLVDALIQRAMGHLLQRGRTRQWHGLQVRSTRIAPHCALPDRDDLERIGFRPIREPGGWPWRASATPVDDIHPWMRLDLKRTARTPRLHLTDRLVGLWPRPVTQGRMVERADHSA